MSRGVLSDEDVEALLDAIREAHAPGDEEQFPRRSLQIVGSLVRTDITSFNEVDPRVDRFIALMEPDDYVFPVSLDVLASMADQHPLIRHMNDTGDGSARKISDFVDLDAFHDSPLYQDFYRHLGVEHQMSITLPSVLPRIVAIAANRRDPDDDFDERDRTILNLLRPHLAQAYTYARERIRLGGILDTYTTALQADGTHVIALEEPPRELTPGALVLLYRYFGRPGAVGSLPSRVANWLEAQRHTHARSEPGRPFAIVRPIVATRDGHRVVMRYLPAASGDALLLNESVTDAPRERLQELGLTEREAQVLALVGRGSTNAQIATALAIADGTVKKHLENVYRKLGVSGRGQAVAMGFDLLADPPG